MVVITLNSYIEYLIIHLQDRRLACNVYQYYYNQVVSDMAAPETALIQFNTISHANLDGKLASTDHQDFL